MRARQSRRSAFPTRCGAAACAPYHDPHDVNYGGPHERARVHDGLRRRARWTASSAPARSCTERARPEDCIATLAARRDGLPRPARDPELLDVRAELRAPGPHVRAERVLEPAGAPVPGLRVVGAAASSPGDPLSCTMRTSRTRACRPTSGRATRGSRLRLDRPHLPAPPPPRQLGLLRQEGARARLRGRADVLPVPAQDAAHARDLEPAAVLRHGPPGPPARQHPGHRATSTRPPRAARCRPSPGSSPTASSASTDRHRSAAGQAYVTSLINAIAREPGLERARRSSSPGTTGAASTTTSCRRWSTRTATASACPGS